MSEGPSSDRVPPAVRLARRPSAGPRSFALTKIGRRGFCLVPFAGMLLAARAASAHDVEPRTTLQAPDPARPAVALTFDACSGATDQRILDGLIADRIPATIFATHRWLRRNDAALAQLLANADLFGIENHGDRHVPAITDAPTLFGLRTAGTLAAVRQEVEGGEAAILAATGRAPHWYRGAGGLYSRDALELIRQMGYAVAGYSLNADVGASLPAATVARRVAAAVAGDVIIGHINQPTRSAGAGLIEGVRTLAARGFAFVRLDAAATEVVD
jgi:peptidoglycan/xylan/chitin deacetylase (PgdA/CDA1 family)